MDPSALSLFVATPQQAEVSRRRTGVSPWGKGMTLDEYVRRDLELEDSECGREGKFMTWVLAPRKDATTLEFLCSCETFRRAGLVSWRDSSGKSEPVVEQVECYGIASVFTPPENRGKGYAHLMMSLLHWVLAGQVLPASVFPSETWGPPPIPRDSVGLGKAAFSALWSDIGDFYETCSPDSAKRTRRNGWTIRGARTTKWYPKKNLEPEGKTMKGLWRWLDDKEAKQLCIHDAERMRSDLLTYWTTDKLNATETQVLFTFLPSAGVEAFQRERQKHFWEKEDINRWGVALGDPQDPNRAQVFATWTLELRPPTRALVVTRLYAPLPEHFAEILRLIWQYSTEHNIETVEIWNCPEHLRDFGYKEARRWFGSLGKNDEDPEFERKEHIPAFKWYGHPGPDSHLATAQIEWLFNEKFCWC